MDAWLEIVRADGTLERQRIEGARVTVGRGANAGISIPDARDLEPEHLMIAPRAEGCWVSASQTASTPVIVDGAAFSHGMLGWGTELEIASLKLKIVDALPKELGGKPSAIGAPVWIALVLALPLIAWLLFGDDGASIDATPAAPPPALFETDVACDARTGTVRHAADRDAEAAIAKSERYPFAAQDGVQAVRLFQRSASCYRAAGAEREARAIDRERRAIAERIEEDYRTHRLRLERALTQDRIPDALLETRALIELTRHRHDDPYLRWLHDLSRQLQLHMEATP